MSNSPAPAINSPASANALPADKCSVELTLAALRCLMWEFPDYAHIISQSLSRGDTYAPKIAPREFHDIIRHIDPDGVVFHIEVFAAHCEVWHAEHWQRSDSRRHQIITRSTERADLQRKQQQEIASSECRIAVLTELRRLMPMLDDNTVQQFATQLSVAPDYFFENNRFPTIKRIVMKHRSKQQNESHNH